MNTRPVWPWVLGSPLGRVFSRAVGQIVRQTQGLPLSGWGSSIRLSPGHVRPNRLLLGFSPHGVAEQRVLSLPDAPGMPLAGARAFAGHGVSARRILLAAEMGHSAVELKAYLPFDPAWPAPSPGLPMRGYKWQPGQGALPGLAACLRVSDHVRPDQGAQEALARLRRSSDASELAQLAYALAEHALTRHPVGLQPDVWMVGEEGNQRASCCIRLYESGLCVADPLPGRKLLTAAWSLQDHLSPEILKSLGPRPPGLDCRQSGRPGQSIRHPLLRSQSIRRPACHDPWRNV